ncbi:MAG: tRNA1(Val) (adenine(37)-N6)-methyltransferase [Acidobacteriota bacterium]
MNIQTQKVNETLDTFYHGKIRIIQSAGGYRFSLEAPLLADFIETYPQDEGLELGTANGIVSLLISIKPFKKVTALEIQKSLAALASRNVKLNHLEKRIQVLQQDLKKFNPGKKYNVVFSNPPYLEGNTGRLSQSPEIAIAKHEVKCTIFDVMRKTARLLKKEGRAYFIFSFRRRDDFVKALNRNGLHLRKERHVIPYEGQQPNFFLSKCDFNSGRGRLIRPLILYDRRGHYSEEAEQIFSGRTHGEAPK